MAASFGFGTLLNAIRGAEKPATITKLGQERAVRPSRDDRQRTWRVAELTWDTILAAIQTASSTGYMRDLAAILSLLAKNPVYRGIHDQSVGGTKRLLLGALSENGALLRDGSTLRLRLAPGSGTPRAERIADMTRYALTDQDAALSSVIEQGLRARHRFGGLTEIGWNEDPTAPSGAAWKPGSRLRWSWVDFTPASPRRIRFDVDSGEIGYAARSYDRTGIPVSAYERGTWATWVPDAEEDEFGNRGTWARLLTDFYHFSPMGGLWVQAVERFGEPAVDVATDDPNDRAQAEELGANLGSQAVYVHSKDKTTVSYLQAANSSAGKGTPHAEFEQRCKQRAAIAFLGAEQTVSVSNGDGSQQSVGSHEGVREDLALDGLSFVISAIVRDLFVPLAILNEGPDAAEDAARYEYQIEKQVDREKELAVTKMAEDLGIDRDPDEVRRALGGWKQPEPGKSLRELRDARGGVQAPSNVRQIGRFA